MRVLNALGKHIGDWNDRVLRGDRPNRLWKIIDGIAGWLYTR